MIEMIFTLGLMMGLFFAVIGGIFRALTKAEERRHKRWMTEKMIEIKAMHKAHKLMLSFLIPKEIKEPKE